MGSGSKEHSGVIGCVLLWCFCGGAFWNADFYFSLCCLLHVGGVGRCWLLCEEMDSHPHQLRPCQGSFYPLWFCLWLIFSRPPPSSLVVPPLHWWGSERGDPGMHSPCCCCCCVSPTHSSPCEGPAGLSSHRGVCIGLPPIHRSSFTFWETWGWVSNWHQAFLSMNAPHRIPQASLCAACTL